MRCSADEQVQGGVRLRESGPASPVEAEQLDRLSEIIPVGLVRTDRVANCLYANDRWCQLTGLPRQDTMGSGWLRAVHPRDREVLLRNWREASVGGREFAEEFFVETPEGETRVVSCRVVPLVADDGSLQGHLWACTDVTERQRTEEKLREVADELEERVKELNCLFGITRISEQYRESLTEILSKTVELLPPSWEHSDVACARIVLGGLEFKTNNYADTPWMQRAGISMHGEEIGWVEVGYLKAMPERDEGPFLTEESSLLHSVAERLGRVAERLDAEKKLDEKENELRSRLTHLARLGVMGEMASSIAHEVNQPLTAVATYAQSCQRMIKTGLLEEGEAMDALDRISAEAMRAGDIVHRLKALVRKHKGRRTDVDVNDLIRDIERLASADARLHDTVLRMELAPSLPSAVADGIQIQQVVLNLIRNAIDAMEGVESRQRGIVVRSEPAEGEIQISVSDNGCGISGDLDAELFQPFFTTKREGLGIGLSISRSIVESHDGRMWYVRNTDGGTTFYFTLPVRSKGND
ncbi:MAG: ATP-binding protein [Gemmatimonadales bacterium]|jgi:PAS domain S-box-containing protein